MCYIIFNNNYNNSYNTLYTYVCVVINFKSMITYNTILNLLLHL